MKGLDKMAEQTYPSISEKNWWTIRDKFKSSLPATVSATYIKTLLTLSSEDSAKSNVIVPLKRLGLIDENNKPTDLAIDWRLDDKYKTACEVMIKNVYPQEFLDLFSDDNIDRASVTNWFMGKGVGSGAAGKMTALFLLLKTGDIKEVKSTKVSAPKKTTLKSKPEAKEQTSVESTQGMASDDGKPKIEVDQIGGNRPNLHIDLQIHISPESTPEQIETIFASMAKHFYGSESK